MQFNFLMNNIVLSLLWTMMEPTYLNLLVCKVINVSIDLHNSLGYGLTATGVFLYFTIFIKIQMK